MYNKKSRFSVILGFPFETLIFGFQVQVSPLPGFLLVPTGIVGASAAAMLKRAQSTASKQTSLSTRLGVTKPHTRLFRRKSMKSARYFRLLVSSVLHVCDHVKPADGRNWPIVSSAGDFAIFYLLHPWPRFPLLPVQNWSA